MGCLSLVRTGVLFAIVCAATAVSSRAADAEQAVEKLNVLSLEELLNVEVTTVQRRASTVGASPAAIHVVSSEDIRRSGALHIAELFRGVPGANSARIDANKWAIGIRGFNARFQDKLLVQVDRRSVYNPLFSGVFWDVVDYPLEDIERIEVIRGPGASVWGANAVNGIINILTKSAKDTLGGMLVSGIGTESKVFGSLRYGGKVNDSLHYRIYAKGLGHDEQFSLTGDPNDRWRLTNGGLRVDWQPNSTGTLTFDAGYLHSVASRKDLRPTTDSTSFADLGGVRFANAFLNIEDEVSDAAHVLARWTQTDGPDSSWSLQVYWDELKRQFMKLDREPRRFDALDVDFQRQFRLGERHGIVYGLGYRYVDSRVTGSAIDEGFIVEYRRRNRHTQLFSGFVQEELALVPDELVLTLGTKLEHNDFTGWEIQPTARLMWTPDARHSAWAAVSRAVRTPNISEDDLKANRSLPVPVGPPSFPAGSRAFTELAGNPDFSSEELVAYELGYRVQATQALSVDLALFYHDYDRLRVTSPQPRPGISLPPGQFTVPVQWQNGMTGEIYGAEIGSTWQFSERARVFGAYSFLQMQLHRRPGLGAGAEAAEGQTPEQQLYLQTSLNLPHDVEVDLIGRFTDRLTGFNTGNPNDPTAPNRIRGYIAVDARVAWRPRDSLELAVVGHNLFDRHHPESGASATVRNPLVEIQRSVYAKLTWRF